MIENARTGEQIEFEIRSPELLVMRSTWTRRGQRVLAHVHPEMEETFEVIEGHAAFRIGGEERIAGPGEVVVVSPGRAHLAWNPTDNVVRIRITTRPALRWAEFTERLFAGEDPARLLSEFRREVSLAKGGGRKKGTTAGPLR